MCLFFTGEVIFCWIRATCVDCETKEEYGYYFDSLTQFMNRETTQKAISQRCVSEVMSFIKTLQSKENKYAGYLRLNLKRCLDAKTTSPVESNNRAIKYGSHKCSSNMHADKCIERILLSVTARYHRRKKGKS